MLQRCVRKRIHRHRINDFSSFPVVRRFLANLVAVFGEYDISGEVESKRSISKNVKRVIVHRQYDAATFENDIALLELESPVNYDQHIVPICMPDDEDDFTGRMAVVTGWGRLKYGERTFCPTHVLLLSSSPRIEKKQTFYHSPKKNFALSPIIYNTVKYFRKHLT